MVYGFFKVIKDAPNISYKLSIDGNATHLILHTVFKKEPNFLTISKGKASFGHFIKASNL